MNRDKHVFQFTGAKISQAAKEEVKYHLERLAFWIEEHRVAVEEAKAKGVELKEYPVTGGIHAEMVINPTLQARINECANKVRGHRLAAEKLSVEADAYGTQLDRVFDLHPDDVQYFRLAGGARVE